MRVTDLYDKTPFFSNHLISVIYFKSVRIKAPIPWKTVAYHLPLLVLAQATDTSKLCSLSLRYLRPMPGESL